MTLVDLDKMERALEVRLSPWLRKASIQIDRHIGDAHAHAIKALTETLKTTPDGRRSAAKVLRSPSYQAALKRLRMLQDALIGPSRDSLDGLLRDARGAFYIDSVALWTPHVPEKFRVTAEPVPTRVGETLMRGAIIHGYDLMGELGPDIDRTANHLTVALNSAGRRHTNDAVASDLLDVWRRQAIERLNRKVGSILSDSDKAIHEATGWLIIHPDYRGERQFVAGGVHF